MDFWEVITRRRSVREFESAEIPQSAVEEIIKAGALAPSGSNAKNWHFIIVRDRAVKEKMRLAVVDKVDALASKMRSRKAREEFLSYSKYFTFFPEAPVVIAVVMKKYDSLSSRILERYGKGEAYSSTAGIQGVAAAIENMLLACADLGMGGCWMTGPLIAKKGLEAVLGVKSGDDLLAIVPVGIPKNSPPPNKVPDKVDDILTMI